MRFIQVFETSRFLEGHGTVCFCAVPFEVSQDNLDKALANYFLEYGEHANRDVTRFEDFLDGPNQDLTVFREAVFKGDKPKHPGIPGFSSVYPAFCMIDEGHVEPGHWYSVSLHNVEMAAASITPSMSKEGFLDFLISKKDDLSDSIKMLASDMLSGAMSFSILHQKTVAGHTSNLTLEIHNLPLMRSRSVLVSDLSALDLQLELYFERVSSKAIKFKRTKAYWIKKLELGMAKANNRVCLVTKAFDDD